MQVQKLTLIKILITGIITILILGLLLGQQVHGGVPGHHILDRKDLPVISNWWGALLLPVLTWLLLSRIEKRLMQHGASMRESNHQTIKFLRLFSFGLFFGILLAVPFLTNFKLFLDNVLYLILLLSLFVPLFYAELILGFILGMTYTFGAVLPTAFILLMAALSFVIYRFIRPLFAKLFGKKPT
ncbi:MAG: hypothetical protein JSS70_11380 [Bacteroidetes bacterium]|nr:hypothetical protein [Bacteroidota bacterium]